MAMKVGARRSGCVLPTRHSPSPFCSTPHSARGLRLLFEAAFLPAGRRPFRMQSGRISQDLNV